MSARHSELPRTNKAPSSMRLACEVCKRKILADAGVGILMCFTLLIKNGTAIPTPDLAMPTP
jgi:hypothetical protein